MVGLTGELHDAKVQLKTRFLSNIERRYMNGMAEFQKNLLHLSCGRIRKNTTLKLLHILMFPAEIGSILTGSYEKNELMIRSD